MSAERDAAPEEWPPRALVEPVQVGEAMRATIERAGGSGIATLADLVSSGDPVLALCAHASRRGALAQRADPRRFGCGAAVHACGRCATEPLATRVGDLLAGSGLVLADWAALARDPALPCRFEHVVLIDPPPFAHLEALAAHGRGYLHPSWGEAELAFALRAHDAEWELRRALGRLYRELRERGGNAQGPQLIGILARAGPHPATPEEAGRCVRVLEELGLVEWEAGGGDPALRVVSSEQTDLERSSAYIAYRARHEEGRRFLSSKQRARAA